jgi:hypothetical protein
VLVQTVLAEARLSVDPAAIVPVLAAAPVPDVRVTVLPLDVTDVVGARLVVVGVRVVVVVVLDVVLGVVVLEVAVGAGLVVVPAGTSVKAG